MERIISFSQQIIVEKIKPSHSALNSLIALSKVGDTTLRELDLHFF